MAQGLKRLRWFEARGHLAEVHFEVLQESDVVFRVMRVAEHSTHNRDLGLHQLEVTESGEEMDDEGLASCIALATLVRMEFPIGRS